MYQLTRGRRVILFFIARHKHLRTRSRFLVVKRNMAQPQGYGYPPPVENNAQYPPPQQPYGGYPPPQAGYPSPHAGYPPNQQPGVGFAPAQPGYGAPVSQQPGKYLIIFRSF